MKLRYLKQSAVLVELDTCTLLFDDIWNSTIAIRKEWPLYIFVSHAHLDHYSSHIFRYRMLHPNVIYIISDDVKVEKDKDIFMVEANREYDIADMHVTTLLSTDEGVAFVIEAEHKKIYFAGDLNWWDWGEEDSSQEAFAMEKAYKKEIEKVRGMKFDIAFVPCDPRLHKAFAKGLLTILNVCEIKYIVPIHFWEDFTVIQKLQELQEVNKYKKQIIILHKQNEVIELA